MSGSIVVSALCAGINFGKLLKRVDHDGRLLVIEKSGRPRAVVLSIREYVRLSVPEPEVLRAIGAESTGRGTDKLKLRKMDRIIKAASKPKRR